MKSIVLVAFALVAVAVAAPLSDDFEAAIVRSDYKQDPEGSFQYGYETSKGTVVNAVGELKQAVDEENKPHTVVALRGSYSYINTDGKPETVNYYADETGYHAEGDSIPKPARR